MSEQKDFKPIPKPDELNTSDSLISNPFDRKPNKPIPLSHYPGLGFKREEDSYDPKPFPKMIEPKPLHPFDKGLSELDRETLAANQREIAAAKNRDEERRRQADLESDRARQAAEARRRGEKIKDYNKPK